jgi:predicted regulator of Ras-like GTPase activity (Roadblock/LC7/MglB family)
MSRLLLSPQSGVDGVELRGRVFWGASVVALLVTAFWNMGVAIEYIRNHAPVRLQVGVFALTIGAALLLGLGRRYAGVEGEKLLDAAASASGVNVRAITACMNVVAATTIVLLLAASMIVGTIGDASVEQLRIRALHLRVLLASSSLFLAIGVAEIYFLFSWPLHILIPVANRGTEGSVMGAIIPTVAGALCTFLLVVIYAPGAVAHEEHVSQVLSRLRGQDPALDVEGWRKANGLNTSVATSLATTIGMLGPILTALGLPRII